MRYVAIEADFAVFRNVISASSTLLRSLLRLNPQVLGPVNLGAENNGKNHLTKAGNFRRMHAIRNIRANRINTPNITFEQMLLNMRDISAKTAFI